MSSEGMHQADEKPVSTDTTVQANFACSMTSSEIATDTSSLETDLSHLTIVESSANTIDTVFNERTVKIHKLDVALEEELKGEAVPSTTDATTIKTSTPNPYHNWECGFGFIGQHDAPDEIPNTKAEFLKAVKGEMATISFIQNGLTSYNDAISSGVHHAFSEDFLKHQANATHRTIGQLFQISNNLQAVIKAVEAVEGDCNEVKLELKEAFGHAQPWIKRTRAILVSAHVFYKINYVLGSDKTKNHI